MAKKRKIEATKETIAECAITKWATGDYKCVWGMFEDSYTEKAIKTFLDKHGDQIDKVEDRLVEIVAYQVSPVAKS